MATALAFDVDTKLLTVDEAVVRVLVNGEDPLRFVPIAEYAVRKGSEHHSITLTAIPVDYGAAGVFGVMVTVAPRRRDGSTEWQPLTRVVIPLVVIR